MKNTFKSIIKLSLIIIVILGIYYAREVEPAEKQRLQVSLENMYDWERVGYEMKADLQQGGNFYTLDSEGRYEQGVLEGDFEIGTELDGNTETLGGSYMYRNSELYINFEDDLPVVLEVFIEENYGYELEEIQNNWIQKTVELPTDINHTGEVPEVISEDEKIDEEEVYHYSSDFEWKGVAEDVLNGEMFTRKKDLNIRKLELAGSSELSSSIKPGNPFPEILLGREADINLEIDFFDIEKEKVTFPEDYLEL